MATPNMGLNLPVVGAAIGPDWAAMLIAALSVNGVDSHDHSSGKGAKVTVAGLNILADLNFQNARPVGMGGAKFLDVVSQSGLALEPGQIARLANDFYIVDGAGNIIPLTLGGKVTLPGRAALSVIGNATASTAAATDIAAALDNQSLQRQGSALLWAAQATLPSARSVSCFTNLTLSGPQSVSGVALVAGDVCLVMAQSTATQNGLYVVQSGAWTRHPAAAATGQLVPGQSCYVTSGFCANQSFQLVNATAPIIATDAIVFNPIGGKLRVARQAISAASSFSFAIPGGVYREVRCSLQVGANAGAAPFLRLNGDTGANYYSCGSYVQGQTGPNWFGSTAFQGNTNGDRSILGLGSAAADLYTEIVISPLASPGNKRRYHAVSEIDNGGTSNFWETSMAGYWLNASDVTSFSVTFGAAVTGFADVELTI